MRAKKVSQLTLTVLVALLCGILAMGCSAQAQSSSAAPALYTRLGGYDAIAAVTDDFLGRLAADKQMSRFFVGVSADSLRKLRQHVVDQLCEASGGPCYYFGRSMKTVHAGLGITESDWQLTVKHLTATFDKFKVPEKERQQVIELFSTLKKDIVEKP
ncbi:MAG TPA: group 1 truncated hemoglobin [Candidatus Saccharimonadales bacterium]|nr:group 1 truncated hemoglobin [Candidatus Saccharimonadales bacterium]